MRILVNGLSVRNMSGRHVLMGHLRQIASWTLGKHEYVVLYHSGNTDMLRDLGPDVTWHECPPPTGMPAIRAAWERMSLAALVRKLGINVLFSPAGMVTPGLPVPQVCFAQNPWALVDGMTRSTGERVKAALQRREYRRAMKEAAVMVFNSEFMRGLYRANAGFDEERSEIVYQAIDELTHAAARSAEGPPRKAFTVLSVSAMARHKNATTLVLAADLLVRRYGVPAEVLLVGPWPDRGYRREVEALVRDRGIEGNVRLLGHISRQELHRHYAEAKVFCLMSRCESFGIPAVEAQAFGTPVISSNCCAIPEICGAGGMYPEPDDVEGVSRALLTLLTDSEVWSRTSEAARCNASRFRWEICSRPLLGVFEAVGGLDRS